MTNPRRSFYQEQLDRANEAIDSIASDLNRARNIIVSQQLANSKLRKLIEDFGHTVDAVSALLIKHNADLPGLGATGTYLKEQTDNIRQQANEIV